jgi:nucleoside-diphosphate-sugar epimerase
LSDPAAVVERVRPERLMHLAWCTEHGRYWTSLENLDWVGATLALVRAFAAAGGRRVVVAGTCAEYDWSVGDGTFSEDAATGPATLYGAAKHGTHAVLEQAGELGVELAWGRVFFLYGPGEDRRRLVASVASALLSGERAPTGDGTQTRDFMHVADVAAAFAALLDSPVEGAVNIASGEARRLRDVIDAVGTAAGHPELVDIGALPARPGDPPRLLADVSRLRDDVGFRPRVSLEEGIEATVAWWRDRLARERVGRR